MNDEMNRNDRLIRCKKRDGTIIYPRIAEFAQILQTGEIVEAGGMNCPLEVVYDSAISRYIMVRTSETDCPSEDS